MTTANTRKHLRRAQPKQAWQQGIALVVVLWLLVLMTVIAASHARIIRTETRLASNQVENSKARSLAEAGVHHAILELLVRDEEDALRANLEFHRAQGVDFFIITDNNSEDATTAIAKEYEANGLAHYILETDDDYNQSAWVTRMARLAATARATGGSKQLAATTAVEVLLSTTKEGNHMTVNKAHTL